jgi:hypothetical protein
VRSDALWTGAVSCGRYGRDRDSAECQERSDDVVGPLIIATVILVTVVLLVWWKARIRR